MLLPITTMAYWSGTAGSTPTMSSDFNKEIVVQQVLVKEQTLEDIVHDASDKYSVPFSELWDTIGGETQWTYDCKMQSNVIYNFSDPRRNIVAGERERSYGCAQIHLPDHPNITYASATDPYFAVDFMAKNWVKHKCWWYYYANKHTDKCIK